jgi:hypothetical protein
MAVLAATGDSDGIDLFTAAAAACISWPQVEDRDAVKAWLRDAIASLSDGRIIGRLTTLCWHRPMRCQIWPRFSRMLGAPVSDTDVALRGSVAIEGRA